MSLFFVLGVSGLILIPFSAATFYFFIGIRSALIGQRENNKAKKIGGYNSMAFSLLAMMALAFLWYIFVGDLVGIGI